MRTYEKIAFEESYPKTKFETRERFFWDTLYTHHLVLPCPPSEATVVGI